MERRVEILREAPRVGQTLTLVGFGEGGTTSNPTHDFGNKRVGETPIVPPLGTMHNAIAHALGVRVNSLPMSPPKLVQAMKEGQRTAPIPIPA